MALARKNAAPTKASVREHATAIGVVWKVRHPYDWEAVDVALDAIEGGKAREIRAAQKMLAELRATNGSSQSMGLRLEEEHVEPNDPDLIRAALGPSGHKIGASHEGAVDFQAVLREPHWVLREANMRAVGLPVGPAWRTGPRWVGSPGPNKPWYIVSQAGVWSVMTWPTEAEAMAAAEHVESITNAGNLAWKISEREARSRFGGQRVRSKIDREQARAIAREEAYAGTDETEEEIMDRLNEEYEITPNRARGPRVYEASKVAREMRETFANRPVEKRERFDFGWPPVMQAIGDSIGVAYGSDKWQDKDSRGRREVELYKHLAESRNRVLARPGVIHDHGRPSERWPVIGPKVALATVPMPADFAVLGLFEGIDLELYTEGTDKAPAFSRGDEGVIHVRVGHGYLGGSKILWSKLDPKAEDEPFLFVYTREAGVMFIVLGDELDIEKDGIVG